MLSALLAVESAERLQRLLGCFGAEGAAPALRMATQALLGGHGGALARNPPIHSRRQPNGTPHSTGVTFGWSV